MTKPAESLFFTLLFTISLLMHAQSSYKQIYIVYMGEKKNNNWDKFSTQSLHHSMLLEVHESIDAAKESLIYSYGRSFNGFAAMLSEEEAAIISNMEEVVSVFPNLGLELQTTRSWDFMEFTDDASKLTPPFDGRNIIIGMFDTGIWPESESFNDEGLGPPPKKWRGKCQTEHNFTCNNKIIGARYYQSFGLEDQFKSARDESGHGSHAASIAAGREVVRANYFGLAKGTAKGGAPNARIAVYKVCWNMACYAADILAAFDDAIADGVDIISASFAGYLQSRFLFNPVAIGSFHAVKNGILTIAAAGNQGPQRGGLANHPPWILTVAASIIYRKFVTPLVLGNGDVITANSINIYNVKNISYPLILGGNATNFSANYIPRESSLCFPGSLNSEKVKGKIVLCENSEGGAGVQMATGAGVIAPNRPQQNYAENYLFQTACISNKEISKVSQYIKSSNLCSKPKANIMFSETMEDKNAPYVASFSSRGPNIFNHDIFKPDLCAPGVNILGAWSPIASPSLFSGTEDFRSVEYNIISGTSVSCPHVTGAAAYVKATHPTWSPAAIKSALMTTANPMDPKMHEYEKEFAYGSGHVKPLYAVDPGLVFNATKEDYSDFFCKEGPRNGCKSSKALKPWDLNYPSLSLAVKDGNAIKGNFVRAVTNVGMPKSTYDVIIDVPHILKVKVEPLTLAFSKVGEEKFFYVEVTGPKISQVPIISGSIKWVHLNHIVRIPIVVYTILPWNSEIHH
ncbi:subtilisin-like protease SBT4.3 isoform X1 [Arachis stenosperma]|uniref:subtilisin-like protease SBT4.3 isoform X1 n=1 Tax=Arachis stenosperma TaxID=217475 RepID=UPI0025AB78D3|nr:subtilisin-like protease SBT4.3 isoform X1 [Arachis stenosperma]